MLRRMGSICRFLGIVDAALSIAGPCAMARVVAQPALMEAPNAETLLRMVATAALADAVAAVGGAGRAQRIVPQIPMMAGVVTLTSTLSELAQPRARRGTRPGTRHETRRDAQRETRRDAQRRCRPRFRRSSRVLRFRPRTTSSTSAAARTARRRATRAPRAAASPRRPRMARPARAMAWCLTAPTTMWT